MRHLGIEPIVNLLEERLTRCEIRVGVKTALGDDVRSRKFGMLSVRPDANDADVGNVGVGNQDPLELGWSDLQRLVFDEFFFTIDDFDDLIVVEDNVSCFVKAVGRDGVASSVRAAQVASATQISSRVWQKRWSHSLHDDRPSDPQLAHFTLFHVLLVVIDDPCLDVG